MENNTHIQMIADYEGDIQKIFEVNVEGDLPILATRNMVLFPGVISPILVGRTSSVNLVQELRNSPDTVIALFCQKDGTVDEPTKNDLYEYGVFAKIIRVLEMPGTQNLTAIVQGLGRCKLKEIKKLRPYIVGTAELATETYPNNNDHEFETAVEDLRAQTITYIRKNEELPDETLFALTNMSNPVVSLNFTCSSMPFNIQDKIQLLQIDSLKERVFKALRVLNKEMQLLELKQNIRSKTREDIDEQQREYFLQQQIKNIKEELGNGEGSPEKLNLKEKAKNKKWSEEVEKIFIKEFNRLDIFPPQSPDYST